MTSNLLVFRALMLINLGMLKTAILFTGSKCSLDVLPYD